MKSLNVIFLGLLVSFASCAFRDEYLKSELTIGVDDYLKSVTINDNKVDLSDLQGLNDWTAVYKLSLTLFPGDEIKIEGENSNDQDNNPKALAAILKYVAQDGKEAVFKTGEEGWLCDSKKPQEKGKVAGGTWNVWTTKGMPGDVEAVWGASKKVKTVCSFVIPKL